MNADARLAVLEEVAEHAPAAWKKIAEEALHAAKHGEEISEDLIPSVEDFREFTESECEINLPDYQG